MKGQKLLRTSAILLIIIASINLLLCLYSLLGSFFSWLLPAKGISLASGALNENSIMLIACYVAFSGLGLVGGIYGLGAVKLPTAVRAKNCLALGLISLITALGGLVLLLFSNGFTYVGMGTVLGEIAVSLLYLIGAFRFKKSLLYLLHGV